MTDLHVRRARTSDIPHIVRLVEPLVQSGILLGKERVVLYESVQEFRIAESPDGEVVGCGALHVMWEDLGEVRTLAVDASVLGTGVGSVVLERLTYREGNRPVLKLSLVEDANRRVFAYAWANPEATAIGLNLGWAQIGLSRDDQPAAASGAPQ